MRRQCFNCGDEVQEGEYEYVGSSRLWVCGRPECNRELSYAVDEVEDGARFAAEEDGYSRYM